MLISHGEGAVYAVGHDGVETPIDIDQIEQVRLEETRLIRLYKPCDTLEICDLIDMPGISDPSMSSEVWMSVMDEVDSVVWCTQATQAWRQSEAATWQQIAERTNGENFLLVTQVDKLHSERDLNRVMTRVHKETQGLFRGTFPISITEAIAAGEDEAKWKASGAADFINDLVENLMKTPALSFAEPTLVQSQDMSAKPFASDGNAAETSPVDDSNQAAEASPAVGQTVGVVPKRVRVLTQMRGRTERPTKSRMATG
ncbi:dynamin family protein [Roseovarius sp. B08]|uniref:dynamin family protein n=1 Tax=Roseovarius sp. B08 TaxID=3449223 RepID=UPI003EDC92A1